jgi:hypothetical protein
MSSGAKRKEYLYPVKHRGGTTMGVISIPAHPLQCVVLKIVRSASVIQTVKKPIQLFKEKYKEM